MLTEKFYIFGISIGAFSGKTNTSSGVVVLLLKHENPVTINFIIQEEIMNKAMVFDKFRKFETEFAGRPLVVETGKMTQITYKEAIVEYGNDIKPLWQECVYSRPYKLESRRYIGCKAKLTDWIFDILQKQTHNVHSFCDIFAGTGSVSNKAIHLYNNVIITNFL